MLKSHKKLSWLLLLIFALRGLVPVGYMIDATDHGLAVVLCDSGVYSAVAQSEHAHHHHHHDGSHPGDHVGTMCPFAVAAANAPAPTLLAVGAVTSTSVAFFVPEQTACAGLSGPSRAQQSRAPPYLS